MACARSALEWPNSFCPENVFRVTAPRKSKFGGLNWVLFHALRSLDCPPQPRLLPPPSSFRSPPSTLSAVCRSLPSAFSLSLARHVAAFSDGILALVVRLTFFLYFSPFLSLSLTLSNPSSPFLLIKIAGVVTVCTLGDATRTRGRSSRGCERTAPSIMVVFMAVYRRGYLRHFTEYFLLLDRV